jgi:predicted CXXCH cytochrome family protein
MNRVVAAALWTAAPLFAVSSKLAVVGSQHDLTAGGSAPVKSAAVDVCIFCHAPHNIMPNITPLWDHTLSKVTYTPYASTTYKSGVQTPSAGSSKLCLSCHDGTVAVGLTVAAGLITTTGVMNSSDVFGTDLSHSHPMSITPVDDGSLVSTLFASPPTTKDPTVLLVSGKIECTTCHDPHVPNKDAANPMFLVRSNSGSAICLACHDPTRAQPNFVAGWTTGSHATATNTVPKTAGFGVYGTVAANACSNCHYAHNDAAGPRNLDAVESAACSPCHSGANAAPALLNVMGEYNKSYSHPSLTVTGAHDAAEALPVNTTRHAACADCHNSHAAFAQTGTALPPAVEADITGVSGYDTSGSIIPAANEYQVCFKCHADSTNKPTTSTYGRTAARYPPGHMLTTYPPQPPQPADQYNLRLKFIGTIGHNIMGNSVVTTTNTSLLPYMLNASGTSNTNRPLTNTSRLYCTDCHNADDARSAGGTGPNGPHGSTYPHLLQFNLCQDSSGGGGGCSWGTLPAGGAGLCSKCHNITTITGESPHNTGDHQATGCTTCHDPHGVIGGTPQANRAMMNFDGAVAQAATNGWGYFYTSTTQRGCFTNCHGRNHNPEGYPN